MEGFILKICSHFFAFLHVSSKHKSFQRDFTVCDAVHCRWEIRIPKMPAAAPKFLFSKKPRMHRIEVKLTLFINY